jgi:hypothetical protein
MRVVLWGSVLVLLVSLGRAEAAGPAIGQLLAAKGTVWREAGGRREPLQARDAVYVADTVVTDAASKAKILLNDGSILSVGENGRLTLGDYQSTANDFTTRLGAGLGAFRFYVPKSPVNGRFEVETDTAVAAVRGTDWVVEVTPDRTSVALLGGVVAVNGRGEHGTAQSVLRNPGEGTDVRGSEPPTPTATWGAQRFAATVERASFD